MSHPILVAGAAGAMQGSTGRRITILLLEQERCHSTGAIRAVTGGNPQTLEEFFRENAGYFVRGAQEA